MSADPLLDGMELDRATSEFVDCDPTTVSGNERKADQYGVPVVSEPEFWAALGVPVTVGH